jgi:tetratricopeptide (TPR) repeat protein
MRTAAVILALLALAHALPAQDGVAEKAEASIREGFPQAAIAPLEEALRTAPAAAKPPLVLLLGRVQLAAGRPGDALRTLDGPADRASSDAVLLRAAALSAQGGLEDAAKILEPLASGSPAAALLLARGSTAGLFSRRLAREVFLSGSVVLLLGSFAIGWIAGPAGKAQLAPVAEGLFPGALCLFLLEMGLMAARQLRAAGRGLPYNLIAFALLMPLFGAGCGWGLGLLSGLSAGGHALLVVLGASASYIAVPAAMRMAVPKADAGIYVTLSVAITFPFNILIGIPLYLWAAGT